MRSEQIRLAPHFFGNQPHHNTVFVVTDDSKLGMEGMEIGRIQLLFSFHYRHTDYSCALINWFVHDDERDLDTGMWTVKQERDSHGKPTSKVNPLGSIAQAVHLIPVYGSSRVPEDFDYSRTLDTYNTFFVNHFVDHHAHKFIGGQ
jgi:hypothetical protein